MRYQCRHGEVRQQERAQDDAGGDGREHGVNRERPGCRQRGGHRQDERERDAALGAREGRGQGAAKVLAIEQGAHGLLVDEAVHNVHPRDPAEAHDFQNQREDDDDAEHEPRITEAAVGSWCDEAGQLHAQQDEDDAVEDEAKRVPDALGLHALARGLGRVAMGEKRHDHARHDHGDDGADVNLVADEVDHEGQKQLEGHVQVGAVDAATADELQQQPCSKAQDDAPNKSAEELQGELLAGMRQGKRPREGEPDGGLEHHRAGHVVEERLTGQKRLVALAEAEVL